MPKPPVGMGAVVQFKFRNSILPLATALKQYLAARSLPSLTDTIEFLEQIERSHPIIQQIALRFYGWVKGVEQQHLRRIATIRLESVGGGEL